MSGSDLVTFSIPHTSPIFKYSSTLEGTSAWLLDSETPGTANSGFQGDWHWADSSQAWFRFNIVASSVTIRMDYSISCGSTIIVNGATSKNACSGGTEKDYTDYTENNLPEGVNSIIFSRGTPNTANNRVWFYGITGTRRATPGMTNVTIDDSLSTYLSDFTSHIKKEEDKAAVPFISYSPDESAWTTLANVDGKVVSNGNSSAIGRETPEVQGNSYQNNSVSSTTQVGAAYSLTFRGNAVYLYGATGPDGGTADVSINGEMSASGIVTSASWRNYRTLLYQNDTLDPTRANTLRIQNTAGNLVIDYADVTVSEADADIFPGKSSPNGIVANGTTSSFNAADEGSSFMDTTAGKIVVYAIAPLVAVILICVGLIFWVRRRNRKSPAVPAKNVTPFPFAGNRRWSRAPPKESKMGDSEVSFGSPVALNGSNVGSGHRHIPGHLLNIPGGQDPQALGLGPYVRLNRGDVQASGQRYQPPSDNGSTMTAGRAELVQLLQQVLEYQKVDPRGQQRANFAGPPDYSSSEEGPNSHRSGARGWDSQDPEDYYGVARNSRFFDENQGPLAPGENASSVPSVASVMALPSARLPPEKTPRARPPPPHPGAAIPPSVIGTSAIGARPTSYITDIYPSDSVSAVGAPTASSRHPFIATKGAPSTYQPSTVATGYPRSVGRIDEDDTIDYSDYRDFRMSPAGARKT